jgi:hypothetical protein
MSEFCVKITDHKNAHATSIANDEQCILNAFNTNDCTMGDPLEPTTIDPSSHGNVWLKTQEV